MAFAFSLTACAQEIKSSEVPSVVTNALQTKFQNIAGVEWEKKGNVYEAELKNNNVSYDVEIDSTGKIKRQKEKLDVKLIPAPVQATIQSQYANHKIDEIEKVDENGTVYYQVELEGKGKDLELVFGTDGKEMKGIKFWD
jgi:uncharacterized membrane protein YkoI